jgi:hypothetical protein
MVNFCISSSCFPVRNCALDLPIVQQRVRQLLPFMIQEENINCHHSVFSCYDPDPVLQPSELISHLRYVSEPS